MFHSVLNSCRVFLNSKACYWCGGLILLMSILTSYYLYLDNLYIVDEVYDAAGPRELKIVEKITIRTFAPHSLSDLNRFVIKYSVCPVVNEIQVVWNVETAPPVDSFFKYPHTHSKVTFNTNPINFITSTESEFKCVPLFFVRYNNTAGVLLLDADVEVSCGDLRFTQTVWRSSRDALVGYFPRLIGATATE